MIFDKDSAIIKQSITLFCIYLFIDVFLALITWMFVLQSTLTTARIVFLVIVCIIEALFLYFIVLCAIVFFNYVCSAKTQLIVNQTSITLNSGTKKQVEIPLSNVASTKLIKRNSPLRGLDYTILCIYFKDGTKTFKCRCLDKFETARSKINKLIN